jgi:hypothetical protein
MENGRARSSQQARPSQETHEAYHQETEHVHRQGPERLPCGRLLPQLPRRPGSLDRPPALPGGAALPGEGVQRRRGGERRGHQRQRGRAAARAAASARPGPGEEDRRHRRGRPEAPGAPRRLGHRRTAQPAPQGRRLDRDGGEGADGVRQDRPAVAHAGGGGRQRTAAGHGPQRADPAARTGPRRRQAPAAEEDVRLPPRGGPGRVPQEEGRPAEGRAARARRQVGGGPGHGRRRAVRLPVVRGRQVAGVDRRRAVQPRRRLADGPAAVAAGHPPGDPLQPALRRRTRLGEDGVWEVLPPRRGRRGRRRRRNAPHGAAAEGPMVHRDRRRPRPHRPPAVGRLPAAAPARHAADPDHGGRGVPPLSGCCAAAAAGR